ncbi:transcriptional regulator FilR1 domain-containing protein [Halorhabdus rudnickae]|uniref:transcriptional regulator FilR1 domain-containing protein n=1 Tax=Halorhabdus rudnickae TaxID=1775544 RepID=UPI001438598A|nr:hypothetical protein [Halorhabdus rudnickae]
MCGRSLIQVVDKRINILQVVCEEYPTKRDLTNAVSDSRATVDRAIRELEEFNLVCRENGSCRPTYTGILARNLYMDFANAFSILENTNDVVSSLSLDENLVKDIFHGGSIFRPSNFAPYEIIDPISEDLKVSNELVLVSPVYIPSYFNQVLSQGAENSSNVDLIINSRIVDILMDSESVVEKYLYNGNKIFKKNKTPNYGILNIDKDIVYVLLFTTEGYLSSIIRNTTQSAVQWSMSRISKIKEESSNFTASK